MPNAAAATLFLAMLVATVGTIVQADPDLAACAAHLSPTTTQSAGTASSDSWEASLEQALRRTERGFQQMAGLPLSR